eukprot:403370630
MNRSRGHEPVKIKSAEKDQLIAELRQQLYDLKNQDRDYRGVNDEIINMENRYKILADDKVRSDIEQRARINRDMDETADLRKQIDDLKYLLSEKTKQSMDLQDELVRSKRVLEEKHYETLRLNEENSKRSEQNLDLRDKATELEKEIEYLKAQKADNWREINRLKEVNDQRIREAGDQGERLKAIDFDLSRTQLRIEDTQKLIDARSYDLRNKQILLDDVQKEIARIKDLNIRSGSEGGLLRRDCDKVQAEIYDLRKEIDYNAVRNTDIQTQIRDLEFRVKDKDDQLYAMRKELDSQKYNNSAQRDSNVDMLNEKDALEKHAAIVQQQNNDITRELDKFCETDEYVRGQLDRRGRVYGIRSKNEDELKHSYYRIEEVRSRSPQRRH